jgi:trk system potassium uptake protein TrkA
MKRIGIIGAGRFGQALTEGLAEKGVEVLLIDTNREVIQDLSEFVTKAVEGDASNVRTLREAGFQDCDTVVVAIGGNLEGSIMATVNCKELGVPTVVAKATSDMHGKVLKRVGADIVVYPNRDRALRLARSLLARNPIDLFEIAEGVSVAEVAAPEALYDKTLEEMAVRKNYGVTVLAIRRMADDPRLPRQLIIATGQERIQHEDRLLVFGSDRKIEDFAHE